MKCWNCEAHNEANRREWREAVLSEDDRRALRIARRAMVPEDHELRAWLLCNFIASLWRLDGLLDLRGGRCVESLLRIGFLDALEEGGIIFWRWDFWNGVHRRLFREQDASCSGA